MVLELESTYFHNALFFIYYQSDNDHALPHKHLLLRL